MEFIGTGTFPGKFSVSFYIIGLNTIMHVYVAVLFPTISRIQHQKIETINRLLATLVTIRVTLTKEAT